MKSRLKRALEALIESGPAPPPRGEHQQAVIRLVIACLIVGYVHGIVGTERMGVATGFPGASIPLGFLAYAFGLYLWTSLDPTPRFARRIVGLLGDVGALSFSLAVTGPIGAPWYPIYLWVIFGNSIRYGLRFLYAGTALSVAGFLAVIVSSAFWQANLPLAVGLLVGLLVLPIYVARLLTSLNNALSRSRAANEAKTRFLANMSHELRTPLNGVIAVSDLLEETDLDCEQQEMVRTIETSANTLLELIDQVLDIARIETGKIVLECAPFDLYRLVRETGEIIRPQANAKGIRLDVYIDLELPPRVAGDGRHLRQVLLNLAGNAVKFTERGRIAIRAHACASSNGKLHARFEVDDTGVGIPEGVREKVFEPFAQADDSVTRRYGGTGLGTTIAKQLVELMGGAIGFESMEGRGTLFWFEVALEPREEADALLRPRHELICVGFDDVERFSLRAKLKGRRLKCRDVADPDTLDPGSLEGRTVVFSSAWLPAAREWARRLRAAPGLDRIALIAIGKTTDDLIPLVEAGYLSTFLWSDLERCLDRALHAASVAFIDVQGKPASSLSPPGAPLRILLAEDNVTNQKVIRLVLERAGYAVDAVADGRAGLDALSETDYHLAIVDLHMPEMGGVEVATLYRMSYPGRALPFLLLTADVTEAAREQGESAAIDGFLTKPVRAEALRAKVKALMAPQVEARNQAYHSAHEFSRAPVLDPGILADLESLESDSPGLLNEVVTAFTTDMKRQLAAMRWAIAKREHQRFIDEAHKSKGGASIVGAKALAAACEAAERVAVGDLAQEGAERLEIISSAFKEASVAFSKHLQSREGVSVSTEEVPLRAQNGGGNP